MLVGEWWESKELGRRDGEGWSLPATAACRQEAGLATEARRLMAGELASISRLVACRPINAAEQRWCGQQG